MRNFILAANAAYPTALPLTTAGQVSISYLADGAETLVKDAETAGKLKDRGMITWKNPNAELGQIVFPFYRKDLTYSVSTYTPATIFSAKASVISSSVVTMVSPVSGLTISSNGYLPNRRSSNFSTT